MKNKKLKPIMFIGSIFAILILAGCTHIITTTNTSTGNMHDEMEEHMDGDNHEKEREEHMDDNHEDGDKTTSTAKFSMDSYTEIIDGKYAPKFSLKNITVKKGDLVKLKIKNIKGRHNFKIDELDVFTDTPEGEEITVEFTADKAGEFVYYCNQPGHRANGHWGTLTVVE